MLKIMDKNSVNKHELSDARRKESVRLRQQEKYSQLKQVTDFLRKSDSNKRSNVIKFDNDDDNCKDKMDASSSHLHHDTKKNKMVLLESSGSEEEEEDDESRFKIKPQFEGERGRQLFEISSSMADERFKLDERFKEAEEMERSDSSEEYDFNFGNDDEMSLKQERGKNLAILEQILGVKMPPKPPDGEVSRKKTYVHFDPDKEDAAKYIKVKDDKEEETGPKKKKKKVEVVKEPEPLPVVSKEKFYHVSTDLKEVLNSEKPFSFAEIFNFSQDDNNKDTVEEQKIEKRIIPSKDDKSLTKKEKSAPERSQMPIENQETGGTSQRVTFFFGPDDPRLKEGLEFFRRTKSIEEIKEQFRATREEVVDLLKKNRRAALKTRMESRMLQQQKYGKKQFGKRKFNKTRG